MAPVVVSQYSSPIGRILAACHNERIIKIALPSESDESVYTWLQRQFPQDTMENHSASILTTLFGQLSDYFGRRLQKFDLPFEFFGTDFQKRVWQELLKIPHGKTRSYADIAQAIGKPTAYRAVAQANGSNSLAIAIPCHRVINSDGALGGYSGHIERKKWLLRHEQTQPN